MSKWQDISTAPRDGTYFIGLVDGVEREVVYGKTSHVPIYGFCLADQDMEDFDLCEPTAWRPAEPPSPQGKNT
jgi:hypothetical protein